MASEEISRLSVVGTMDSPDQFAQFWLAVGHAAGFEVSTTSDAAKPSEGGEMANSRGDGEQLGQRSTDDPKSLTEDQRSQAEGINTCASRIWQLAKERATPAPAASSRVELLASWKNRSFTTSLGREPERRLLDLVRKQAKGKKAAAGETMSTRKD